MTQGQNTQQSQKAQTPTHKPNPVASAASAAVNKVSSMTNRAADSASTAAKQARSYGSLTLNQFIGICIWMVGMWLTAKTLTQLGISDEISAISGFVLQLALTRAESPLWRGRGLPKMAIAAVVFDVLINTAGAWPYTRHVGNTDFWAMIREVSENPQLQATIGTQFAFALVVGAFTAAAAEYFWNL